MVKAAPSVFEVPSKKRPRMFALAVVVPVPSSKTTRATLPIAATAGFACQLALALDVQRIGDAELRRGSGRIHHIEEDVVVGSRRPDALERDDLAPARERGDRRVLQGVMSGPGVEVADADRRQDCSGRRDRHIGDVGSVRIDGAVGVAIVLKDHAEAAVQAFRDRRHFLMGAEIEDVAIGQGCAPDRIEDRDDRIGVGGAAEVVRLIGDDKTAVGQQLRRSARSWAPLMPLLPPLLTLI